MGAGCCISEFVDVLAGVRSAQAADGELEPTLIRVFASVCPYTDKTPTGCISTVLQEGCHMNMNSRLLLCKSRHFTGIASLHFS